MDILLQSDGQLYPPKKAAPKPPPPKPKPSPQEESCAVEKSLSLEDILLVGIAFVLLRNMEQPDLPLLLALAYILFDRDFSLKGLL